MVTMYSYHGGSDSTTLGEPVERLSEWADQKLVLLEHLELMVQIIAEMRQIDVSVEFDAMGDAFVHFYRHGVMQTATGYFTRVSVRRR